GKQFLTDLEKQGRLNENIEVAILQGIIGQEATIARSEGFKEIIAPYSNITIIREGTGRWERGLAVSIMENWIQADTQSKLKVVFANNDEMAIGASLAAQQANRNDILIYGVDASPAGVAALGNGLQATVEQDPVAMGRSAIEITMRKLIGDNMDDLVNNKYKYIPLNTVTLDNKAEFLEKLNSL
ncbi:MAG: substrate-binding domain-containing protein, partial [Brevinema sp.]